MIPTKARAKAGSDDGCSHDLDCTSCSLAFNSPFVSLRLPATCQWASLLWVQPSPFG